MFSNDLEDSTRSKRSIRFNEVLHGSSRFSPVLEVSFGSCQVLFSLFQVVYGCNKLHEVQSGSIRFQKVPSCYIRFHSGVIIGS